jgi:hypothetical protein
MNKKTNDMKHSKQGKKITKSSAGNGMDNSLKSSRIANYP